MPSQLHCSVPSCSTPSQSSFLSLSAPVHPFHSFCPVPLRSVPFHSSFMPAGTAITTALTCTRRAWLGERFAAAGGGPSAAALRGTLLHELLQRLLVEVVGADADAEMPGVQQLEQMVSMHVVPDAVCTLAHT